MAGPRRPRAKRRARDYALSEELRAARLTGGGDGCLLVVTSRGREGYAEEWLSPEAIAALIRGAARLGYRGGFESWLGVVEAIALGGFADLLSEAIEETETDAIHDPQAGEQTAHRRDG
jgi:hypothetical protein